MNQAVHAEAFLDLEIRISPQHSGAYPVELIVGREQSFRGKMDAGLAPAVLFPEDPIAAGEALFEALAASDDLRRGWAQAIGRSPKRRVRLNIDPAAPELHKLPWELLRAGGEWLAASAATPFSRYLPVERPWGTPARRKPFRVLAVISSPADLSARFPGLAPVDLEAERRAIQTGLPGLAGAVQVDFLEPPAALSRLEERLQEGYDGLHITGHGALNPLTGSAAVLLQNSEGNSELVIDDHLAGVLARLAAPPRLVFLMACRSAARAGENAFAGLAPRLVAAGVPAVLAVQGDMTMPSGQRLAESFYRRLAAHGQVDLAVNEARSTLITSGRPDAHLPVLFMRTASGMLWEEAPAAPPQTSQARPARVVNTGGGTYIEGSINTGGGDFIGRDKITYAAPPPAAPDAFRAVRRAAARHPSPETRASLEDAVAILEAEARKGAAANEERILQQLTFLFNNSPEVWQTALNAFQAPASGLPAAFRRAALRSAGRR